MLLMTIQWLQYCQGTSLHQNPAVCTEFLMGSKFDFSQWKRNLIKFKNVPDLILCKLPALFSTVKLKFGHNLFLKHSQIQNRDFKMLFLGCTSKFSQFTKILKIGISEYCSRLSKAEHLRRVNFKTFSSNGGYFYKDS